MSNHSVKITEESLKKEWHNTITSSKRNDLVQKFAQALMPIWDKKQDLLMYSKKIENEYFENAKSRQDYELKLAQQLLEKEKELKESAIPSQPIPIPRTQVQSGANLVPLGANPAQFGGLVGQDWLAPESRQRNNSRQEYKSYTG